MYSQGTTTENPNVRTGGSTFSLAKRDLFQDIAQVLQSLPLPPETIFEVGDRLVFGLARESAGCCSLSFSVEQDGATFITVDTVSWDVNYYDDPLLLKQTIEDVLFGKISKHVWWWRGHAVATRHYSGFDNPEVISTELSLWCLLVNPFTKLHLLPNRGLVKQHQEFRPYLRQRGTWSRNEILITDDFGELPPDVAASFAGEDD